VRKLVFLDETGLNTKMSRLYGRSPRGERCIASVPHGHWQSSTFIAALRHDRLTAPWLLDGPMDGASFLEYIKQVLAPELTPGDLVICDNLSSHKVAGVKEAIQSCGAELLYLPPYSPDLNPIEMVFSKLKAILRQKAERSFEGLISSTALAIDAFLPSECLNFFRHANYASI
jgi:transposase